MSSFQNSKIRMGIKVYGIDGFTLGKGRTFNISVGIVMPPTNNYWSFTGFYNIENDMRNFFVNYFDQLA